MGTSKSAQVGSVTDLTYVQASGSGYNCSSTHPDCPSGSQTSRIAGKACGLLSHWSSFDRNQNPESWNGSKFARFLSQSAFPGGLLGDIFFVNDQSTFCFIFHYYCFLWGSVSWENSELEGLVPSWNSVKFQNPPQNGRPSFSQGHYL